MKHNPSRKASHSSTIPAVYKTGNFITVLDKSSPLGPTLRQNNQVHAFPSYFLKINFKINLPFTTTSSKCSPSFLFPLHRNPECTFPVSHRRYKASSSYYSWFDVPNNIWSAQTLKISLCSFLYFHVTQETETAVENKGAIKLRNQIKCTATLATYHKRSAYIPCNKLYFYRRQESTSWFNLLRQLVLLYHLHSPN